MERSVGSLAGRLGWSRRGFLRGVGVSLALPLMGSLRGWGAAAGGVGRVGVSGRGMPLRLGFLYVPNGVNQECWFPTGEGKGFELNKTMEPLGGVKRYIQVFSELDQRNANARPGSARDETAGRGGPRPPVNIVPGGEPSDGPGEYSRASGVWLTGERILKSGVTVRGSISIDQVAAGRVGKLTRVPSLVLTCDEVKMTGLGESGYCAAYTHTISWKDATTPMVPEADPRAVFGQLFGVAAGGKGKGSLLDSVLGDAGKVRLELGVADGRTMDAFLAAVREVEVRIERLEKVGSGKEAAGVGETPLFEERIQAMLTILALAFQTDSTRVATCMLAHEGDNRAFTWLGQTGGHASLSRHMGLAERKAQVAAIDQWYVKQLAAFLTRLEGMKEGEGESVLENSMIVYGGGISDGYGMKHHNLPVIVAGGGGGGLNAGRYVKLAATGTPLCNLYVGLLGKLGVRDVARFGDSTGVLADL